MIHFRQLFDETSSTYTYLLGDPVTGDAVLIDPVQEQVDRDLQVLAQSGLQLRYVLETHAHADHITGAAALRERTEARIAVGAECNVACADQQLSDGDIIVFGNEIIHVMATPGHTPGSVTFQWRDRVFTGDTLLIAACGRTDFQHGDANAQYDSLQRLMTLRDDVLVYPGHDYKGRTVSSIGEERRTNPYIVDKTRAQFVELMANLNLARPRLIDIAVPANRRCGMASA